LEQAFGASLWGQRHFHFLAKSRRKLNSSEPLSLTKREATIWENKLNDSLISVSGQYNATDPSNLAPENCPKKGKANVSDLKYPQRLIAAPVSSLGIGFMFIPAIR
jgi:hypothetical protein